MKKPFSKLFGLKNKDDLLDASEAENQGVKSIKIERIVPNRYQPRQKFDTARIEELAESISAHGLLQPIVVRPIEENMYEIIAGERRFRALQMNQMTEAEVLIRHLDDEETAVVALIENIQRENLSAIEEAEAYKKLLAFEGITQAELAKSVGKSQSFIANKLRLLKLTPVVLEAVREHRITERHARALVGQTPERQEEMLHIILTEQLNVKQTEDRLKMPVEKDIEGEKVVATPPEFIQDVSAARDIIADSLLEVSANGIKYEQREKEHDDYVEIQIRLYRK
ncbi:ParB/RepB/Spo0J family partition protein [Staphylococcus schleiferi]|uniref:ParB/RepB/Spo0J family partition protein n=1 Tax=Staphylococcus schleiferi TaxID=1295 RepID=UPI001887FFF6|nr:ParB/RepB/Spo0J family partition protein [Staphylococcus schleiferi]MBF1992547.1 ParB/RepB/Spo0J family partition protein [Staphylococcus schleiferi]MBF2039021.1 ParB/RepB/Spo0J family partition protein [Staphylococcus schleiferi]MBF2100045.1 ParB/RepB/Spo0J family partition protein [Staphylococcus schleiferi]MBF2102365.1 ParB/RepB/Spo0J family partition protein [Staphylococcus schleiferi]MBF2104512.1 ParB/RepB/Spo0J family partition protein [Staphylococcus schleiferi]